MIQLKFKPGVSFGRVETFIEEGVSIRPAITIIILAVMARFEEMGAPYCMITSACEGKHGENSLHYEGLALDFRIRHLRDPHSSDEDNVALVKQRAEQVAAHLREDLGDQYDVVLHSTHIHIEFDPD